MEVHNGCIYRFKSEDGETHQMEIVNDEGDGTLAVLLDNSQEISVVSKEWLIEYLTTHDYEVKTKKPSEEPTKVKKEIKRKEGKYDYSGCGCLLLILVLIGSCVWYKTNKNDMRNQEVVNDTRNSLPNDLLENNKQQHDSIITSKISAKEMWRMRDSIKEQNTLVMIREKDSIYHLTTNCDSVLRRRRNEKLLFIYTTEQKEKYRLITLWTAKHKNKILCKECEKMMMVYTDYNDGLLFNIEETSKKDIIEMFEISSDDIE